MCGQELRSCSGIAINAMISTCLLTYPLTKLYIPVVVFLLEAVVQTGKEKTF